MTAIQAKNTNAIAGLGAIGDEKNAISILFTNNKIKLVALKNDIDSTIAQRTIKRKTKYI